MTRLSRVPLPRALAHADGEGRLSGGSCASTEGAHGQGHWNGGAAQRHLSTFTTAATTQPSSIAIRKLKSGCTAVAAAAASAAADSAIASFGYSLMTASIMRGVAAAAASAAMAAVRSLKRPVTTVEAEAAAAAAPAAMGGGREAADAPCLTPSPSNATVLSVAPRGAALVVVPTTSRERARWRVSWRRGACCWPRR